MPNWSLRDSSLQYSPRYPLILRKIKSIHQRNRIIIQRDRKTNDWREMTEEKKNTIRKRKSGTHSRHLRTPARGGSKMTTTSSRGSNSAITAGRASSTRPQTKEALEISAESTRLIWRDSAGYHVHSFFKMKSQVCVCLWLNLEFGIYKRNLRASTHMRNGIIKQISSSLLVP